MKSLALALLLILVPESLQAHEMQVGDLVIVHPTVDEADKDQAIAKGSMEIRNDGSSADKLLSMTAEFADEVGFETPGPIKISPNGRALIPLVFHNIKRKLSEDEAYSGELIFEHRRFKIDILVHRHVHSSSMPGVAQQF
jgi:periplasmic copper chaperone A